MSQSEKTEEKHPEDVINEVHVGVNDVDNTPVFDDGDDNHARFQLKTEPVFNQLADSMYETDEAGIREALTNAVTSVLRAQRRGYLEEGEGTIEFRLYESSGSDESGLLTLKDNGVGMSWNEIQEVVSIIGATTSRGDGDLAGQFGMGFLALFKLVGLDGSFVMHSNSRLNDNEPFCGVWDNSGFSRDSNRKMASQLDEDEYGVRFDFPLHDTMSIEDIESWVREYAKWSRVPVVLQRYDASGKEVVGDELGGTSITDSVSDENAPYVEYEDEYVHAIQGPEVENNTLLLDVPVRRGRRYTLRSLNDAPFGRRNLLIRLKNENGVVVEGPHEGKMTANSKEYKAMQEQGIADEFVPEDELENEDIVMPGPRGNRDVLDNKEKFWEWVANRLSEDYDQQIREITRKVDSIEDVYDLSGSEFQLYLRELPSPPSPDEDESPDNVPSDRFLPDKYKDKYSRSLSGSITDEFAEKLNIAVMDMDKVKDGASVATGAANKTTQSLLETLYDAKSENGDVYMGVTMNDDRYMVVNDDDIHNQVICPDGTDWYDTLDSYFDCRLLKRVTQSRLDEYDISDEVREKFLMDDEEEEDSSDSPDTVMIHFGTEHNTTSQTVSREVGVDELVEECEGSDEIEVSGMNPNLVVAFPRSGDYRLSDHREKLSSRDVGVFSATKSEWETLEGTENIFSMEQYVEKAKSTEFETSDGAHTVESATQDADLVIHALPSETFDEFTDENVMDSMAEILENDSWYSGNWKWGINSHARSNEKLIYAPVSKSMLDILRPCLHLDNVIILANEVTYNGRDHPGNTCHTPPDSTLYAIARLYRWSGTPELGIIEEGLEHKSAFSRNKSAVKGLVDTLEKLYNDGEKMPSQKSD